jgi:hypothetical protein
VSTALGIMQHKVPDVARQRLQPTLGADARKIDHNLLLSPTSFPWNCFRHDAKFYPVWRVNPRVQNPSRTVKILIESWQWEYNMVL